ncbi:hypothetical protein HaLaN_06512, partial [Haematococcus lacustris]
MERIPVLKVLVTIPVVRRSAARPCAAHPAAHHAPYPGHHGHPLRQPGVTRRGGCPGHHVVLHLPGAQT